MLDSKETVFDPSDINECADDADNDCSAQGTCVNSPPGSYSCNCDPGYTGRLCDTGQFIFTQSLEFIRNTKGPLENSQQLDVQM